MSGKIQLNDEKKFQRVMFGMPEHTRVFLDSEGGSAVAGIYIGLMIRSWAMDTVIGPDMTCASACADIWLAGSRRFIAPSGHVGFHGSSINGRRSEAGDDVVRGYYKEIGLSRMAADTLLSPDPEDILWLNDGPARRLGIVALDWPPKGAPSSPQPRVAAKPEPQPTPSRGPYQRADRLQNGTEVPSPCETSPLKYTLGCARPDDGVPSVGGRRCNFLPDGRQVCVDTYR